MDFRSVSNGASIQWFLIRQAYVDVFVSVELLVTEHNAGLLACLGMGLCQEEFEAGTSAQATIGGNGLRKVISPHSSENVVRVRITLEVGDLVFAGEDAVQRLIVCSDREHCQ
ncbi:jg12898 [Pararge aegeria aegeria]|uniref:Jg12898 protein n=1 Tax=Pararge aegeria aegeria TaxID=348720 RepID=A0A8S4QFR1_9NEOP|nr:jg12898 [Pararge aegeria aegeria]